MSKYIEKQAAIEAIANCTNIKDEGELRKYVSEHHLEYLWSGGVLNALDAVKEVDPADVLPVKAFEEKIGDLKRHLDCHTPNIDYYSGYMSALDAVEGILAKARERSEHHGNILQTAYARTET